MKAAPAESRIGSIIIRFNKIPSTNEYAKKFGKWGAKEGIVVLATQQTGGRGRLGRAWQSTKGGLYFSILLRPCLSPDDTQKITLLSGVAVAKSLKNLYGLPVRLKWPNDVLLKGRKVCGILTESAIRVKKIEYVIVGIGININNKLPVSLEGQAITLRRILGKKLNDGEILVSVLEEFERLYNDFKINPDVIVPEWLKLSDTIGKNVEIIMGDRTVKGIAHSITEDGALILRTSRGGRLKILAGDCIYVG